MLENKPRNTNNGVRILVPFLGGILAVAAIMLIFSQVSFNHALAAPIPPPEGYPKLSISTKVVTPSLTGTGGETLEFTIEIINTGAYAAEGVTLEDMIPENTTFVEIVDSTVSPAPVYSVSEDKLTWTGDIGFDSTGIIRFSVLVDGGFSGIISNTAVVDHPDIPQPVEVTAEATITDDPILVIEKTSSPAKPGPNKELVYEITVTNLGQDANNLDITVTDDVPANTTFDSYGPDGSYTDNSVTWNRILDLDYQASTVFYYTVTVGDVPSGTVITNDNYNVTSPGLDMGVGEVYTTTIIDPILFISKDVEPYPPGSNREMTYYLTVLNKGSEAEGLTITDEVPTGVTYVDGGDSYSGGIVTWYYPSLDTGESAVFTYTVDVPDIAQVDILNETYSVCDENDICAYGEVLTSLIEGPTFELTAELDPIAKKPGGGSNAGDVTPTLTIENLGPGNALNASATIIFERISVSAEDMEVIPDVGFEFVALDCGEKCTYFEWVGDIAFGQVITFTTSEGQSTIGGEEGTEYKATLVVEDTLGDFTTEPITATATGLVTHHANLLPVKSAPAVIGAGQEMTYVINVLNTGLSTDEFASPSLTETLPADVTFVDASDGGVATTEGDQTVVSWALPAMSTGETLQRTFTVLVDPDLVSGTQIINDDYWTGWFEDDVGFLSNIGEPFTTTVKEVGLIDSDKTVTPALARPGPGNILTYTVNVVNSGPNDLTDVWVYDILPWESSTYQRDAIASAGEVISDIVSIDWHGDVSAYSSETITFTVEVDQDYEGPVTNTATIQHTSLITDVVVEAIAYITNDPVLQIFKKAEPDPVKIGNELLYTVQVDNLGQTATELEVWDTIPDNTTYVDGSASAGGTLVDGKIVWNLPVLNPFEQQKLYFKVTADYGKEIINSDYGVTCSEGVIAYGDPVTTGIKYNNLYLPIIYR